VIWVYHQATPEVAAETTFTLTVAALEVAGRIGLLLAAAEFPVGFSSFDAFRALPPPLPQLGQRQR
jgi:hypothetical protein